MKIAIVTHMFPPDNVGGIEIASQDIANLLAQKGNDVYVVTSGKRNLMEKPNQNVIVYRCSNSGLNLFDSSVFWLKAFFALTKIKPDIVHCQAIPMGVPAFLFKQLYRKPYIVWCHGFDVYNPWKFKKIISRAVLNSADAVIALTNHMREMLQKSCNKDIAIIPNSLNVKKFESASKNLNQEELGIEKEDRIILFVGTLNPVKGLQYLVEAFKTISRKIPKAKLLLVGDGPERRNLENMVKKNGLEDKVSLIGRVENDEVPKYMTIADVFVLPSLSESFGIVNLEAMACGLPIVATRVDGIPEVVNDPENGFLVEPMNSGQIAAKVILLLENDALREKMGKTNREKAKEYGLEKIIGKIEKIYSEVLAKENHKMGNMC